MLHPYDVKAGGQVHRIWATGAAEAISEAIERFGCMGASARRAA